MPSGGGCATFGILKGAWLFCPAYESAYVDKRRGSVGDIWLAA